MPTWNRCGLPVLLLAGVLSACASRPPAATAVAAEAGQIEVWLTTSDHAKALSPQPATAFAASAGHPRVITVDATQRYQRMVGFGASITDASAWLIQHRMQPAQRQALLQELFGRSPGIGLDFARLTIGASDFSRTHYSLNDLPPGEAADPDLRHFSIDANLDDVVPVTRAALEVNPGLQIMASPWSAPAWMKSSGSLIKGQLSEAHYDAFARYLLKYVDAYAAQGIPVFALTLQNEPSYEPGDYPGMRLSAAARAALIGRHLGPMIEKRGGGPLIFDWDHNWDLPEEPLAVLADPLAAPYVSGVAWHCYGGRIEAQSQIRDRHPDKDVYLTECSGGDWEPVKSGGLTQQVRTLVVNGTRHWARGVLFWNLALDENNGPHKGGCGTCRGLVTIDSATGEVSRTDDYYALAHASRFVRAGAYRIASSEGGDGLDNVAFLNPDGSRVLLVVNSDAAPRGFRVSAADGAFDYELPAKSVATFVWRQPAQGGAGGRD